MEFSVMFPQRKLRAGFSRLFPQRTRQRVFCPVPATQVAGEMKKDGFLAHSRGGSRLERKELAARYFPTLLGAVSSPRAVLTAVFGMGTGVCLQPKPPIQKRIENLDD